MYVYYICEYMKVCMCLCVYTYAHMYMNAYACACAFVLVCILCRYARMITDSIPKSILPNLLFTEISLLFINFLIKAFIN